MLSDRVRAFLDKPNLGVLATVGRTGAPQATPVWFLVDGDRILVNTSAGRVKLRNVRRTPPVALVVVDHDDPYAYVQIQGRVEAFDREGGARDIDRLSWRYRGRPYRYPPTDAPERRISLLIVPERVSGSVR